MIICTSDAVREGALTPASIGRAAVVLTRHKGVVHAVAARCPHQGADLAAGCLTGFVDTDGVDADRLILRCPWHGFEFEVASGDPTVAAPEHHRLRLRRYAVREENGHVLADA